MSVGSMREIMPPIVVMDKARIIFVLRGVKDYFTEVKSQRQNGMLHTIAEIQIELGIG